MAQDWFSEATQPVGQPVPSSGGQQPRVRPIFTAPPKTPDPIEQRREMRAENSDARAQAAAERAAAAAERAAENDRIKNQREQAEFERKQRQFNATGGLDVSVEQGKAAAFYKRALGASQDYARAGLDPDSMIGKYGSETFPQITAGLSSDERNA